MFSRLGTQTLTPTDRQRAPGGRVQAGSKEEEDSSEGAGKNNQVHCEPQIQHQGTSDFRTKDEVITDSEAEIASLFKGTQGLPEF